jgi:hypothetical protein
MRRLLVLALLLPAFGASTHPARAQEPGDEVTLELRSAHAPVIEYDDPFTLVARTGTAGAEIVFQRRWVGTSDWRPVARTATDGEGAALYRGRAVRAADWRARWVHPGEEPSPLSDAVRQQSNVDLSHPRVNGTACGIRRYDPKVCRSHTVDSGRVVLTGTGYPGRSAEMVADVWIGRHDASDTTSGEKLVRRRVVIGRDGHWSLRFRTRGHDRLTVYLYAGSLDFDRHFASTSWLIPLRVR